MAVEYLFSCGVVIVDNDLCIRLSIFPSIEKIKRKFIPLVNALCLLFFALSLLNPLTAFSEVSHGASSQDDKFSIWNGSYDKNIGFSIPKIYGAEIHSPFFRLVVDYPSMSPTAGPKRFKLNKESLEIVVSFHPKNGTDIDDVISGRYGAKLVGTKNGYDLYTEPLGKTGKTEILSYRIAGDGDVIIKDPGDWSVRYEMSYALDGLYVVKCYINKNLDSPFRDIQRAVSGLIETFRDSE